MRKKIKYINKLDGESLSDKDEGFARKDAAYGSDSFGGSDSADVSFSENSEVVSIKRKLADYVTDDVADDILLQDKKNLPQIGEVIARMAFAKTKDGDRKSDFIETLISVMNEVGVFSDKQMERIIKYIKQSKTFEKLVDEHIPDDVLVDKLKEGLEAEKYVVVKGAVVHVPDYGERGKYVDRVIKIKHGLNSGENSSASFSINVIAPDGVEHLDLKMQQNNLNIDLKDDAE